MSFRSLRLQLCAALLLVMTVPTFASAHKTISPQPKSISVGRGMNLNAGISALNLQYMLITPAPPFPRLPGNEW